MAMILLAIVLLAARLVLAAVFTVSGIAKLADQAGSRQAMRDFGVPDWLATPAGIVLPLVELVLALGLLCAVSAQWGAMGTAGLLLLFMMAIGYNLARGRAPDCHCFGQLHSAPVGWSTLWRNLGLTVIASLVIWQGPGQFDPQAAAWIGSLSALQRAELLGECGFVVLLVALSWLLLQVLRQQGRLLLRIEELEAARPATEMTEASAPITPEKGLTVGSVAPKFALPNLLGEPVTLDALLSHKQALLLVFSDPGCGPCKALMPEMSRWQGEYMGKLNLVVISRGDLEANQAKAAEHGLTSVLRQQDREIAQLYQVDGTPSAVLVRPDGTIGSPLAEGAESIRALVTRTASRPVAKLVPVLAPCQSNFVVSPAEHPHAGKGEPAPDLTLPDLHEKRISLAAYRGKRTLLLFWNPRCGFCERMVEDLKSWERTHTDQALRLLLISTGTVEENAAMGLRSPILLDQGMRVGSRFGANGTPMAVLVDERGIIASELAAGAPAVLALLNSGTPLGRALNVGL